MPYTPGKLPQLTDDDAISVAQYLEDELQRIATSQLEDVRALELGPATVAPLRPRTGMIVYADGVHWNPGSGEGVYTYGSDGLWHLLNNVAPPAPTMALLETITFAGAASYASSVSWAGYNHIKFLISNLIASATVNTPCIQYHSAGAYQTVNYVSGASLVALIGTPVWSPSQNSIISVCIYGGTDLTAASIPEGGSFEGTIFNVASTTMHKYTSVVTPVRSATSSYNGFATGLWTGGLTVIDGFKLFMGNGANINSGVMQIYGIK